MKRVLYFCKIFSPCPFIFYLLTSCNDGANNKADSDVETVQPFRKGVITITGGDTLTGKLVMKDDSGHAAHNFNADHGQTIKWIVHPHSNVKEIIAIPQKDTSDNNNIFSELPTADGNSQNWKATIDTGAYDLHEWYNIIWKDTSGKTRTYDPFIQVNPRPFIP